MSGIAAVGYWNIVQSVVCHWRRSAHRFLRAALLFCLLTSTVRAKEVPLIAIAVFDSPNGAAYGFLSGVMLNGKAEVRICDDSPKIDKNNYARLGKVQLKGASTLDRGSDGVLMMTQGSRTFCVLPSNLKLEKGGGQTRAEVADQAILQGAVIPASDNPVSEVPEFKRGVKLFFIAAPDTELGEYLRAERARTIPRWQEFLHRHPASPHGAEAKKSLAVLFDEAAEAELAQFRSAEANQTKQFPHLKKAQQQLENAVAAGGLDATSQKLMEAINRAVDQLLELNRARLQAYRKALADHTPGYAHFLGAQRINELILEVTPKYAPALAVKAEIVGDANQMDAALQTAEFLTGEKRYDEAFKSLGAYRVFEPEASRVAAVVTAAYSFHFNRGQEMNGQQNWEQAVAEFRRAAEIRSDSKEAGEALDVAENQLTNTRNRQAADRAIQLSAGHLENKEVIEAYEVLADLPPAPRALVKNEMEPLQADYLKAASQRAQSLQDSHTPIRGRADEDAVRRAYGLLERASGLSDDQAIKLKLDLLADKISTYYVEQAKKFLEKPMSSGVSMGFSYLGEALRYKQNLDVVHDQMTRYRAEYQVKGKLSITVGFRDQTSRRDSIGFADQLGDAIATDLESSGLPVKIVRQGAEGTAAAPANFRLMGEINEHRTLKMPTTETLQSKYRFNTREVKSETWLKLNHEYEDVQREVTAAEHAEEMAVGHNKKKEIKAADAKLEAVKKKAEEVRNRLDATEQTQPEDIIKPYNYTRTTVDLKAEIGLAFRITDQSGNLIVPTQPLHQENQKTYVLLENVKPEDTESVRGQIAVPDEVQFMIDLEIRARDLLIKAVHEEVVRLPEKVFQEARKRALQDDAEGAADEYILYLNSTPNRPSSEREEAVRFLRDHFNVALVPIT